MMLYMKFDLPKKILQKVISCTLQNENETWIIEQASRKFVSKYFKNQFYIFDFSSDRIDNL